MKFFIIVSLLITHATARKPNLILIYMDDMGYGDIGCFGSTKNRTPILDQMAREGRRFTDFYVTSGVCTPSRSSLLTGCYPRRLNMHIDQNNKWVLFPNARKGLNPEETTVAELLKKQGYATTCIGKWHLGDQPEFLPTNHGFDSYFGIPYSNDMGRKNIPLPLLRDDKVIEAPVAQSPVTRRYTDEAVKFIKANREKPFFLYLPHTSVHLPLFPGEDFKGKSANGKYGDWIEEVDACTGVILQTLRDEKLDQDTLVIFTSDNGGSIPHAQSNLPLRGGKQDHWEGGIRVPTCVVWPGKIPAGKRSNTPGMTMDFLPTLAKLAGLKVGHEIDGQSLAPVWTKGAAGDPDRTMIWVRREGNMRYQGRAYYAIRQGNWKLLQNSPFEPMVLIDLKTDPYEKNPLPAEGKIAKELRSKLMQHIQKSGSIPWQRGLNEKP